MSIQFGRWNIEGKPVGEDYLEKVKPAIAPFGPDDGGSYTRAGISILFRAFHTNKESRCEIQPHITESGAILVWDGRLDNRAELIRELRNAALTINSPDVSIVAAAYEAWGTDCFAKLIGDWALSIWGGKSGSLILAKDPIGVRHLYYAMEKDQVTWSTLLDPLVLLAGHSFALNEEYIAGWFSFFPAAHLTPYIGIHSVPPSSFVVIQSGKCSVRRYWDFDPHKRIRYPTDAEYEEHFRAVFGEAVRRRLRSERAILAELSGGMDSSSIVCTADSIIGNGSTDTSRLDTVSYFNDSEPNWNERPYFTIIEKRRGRVGCHIDVALHQQNQFDSNDLQFTATPGSGVRANRQFVKYLSSQETRVVLSGIGGDEVMGGVPTPSPELEDILARAQFRALARRLKLWALEKRKPWVYLLFEAACRFLPPAFTGSHDSKQPPPWLAEAFVKRNRRVLSGYEARIKLFSGLPSFQENILTLDRLRRQLACQVLPAETSFEKRYPYLDRDLLEFIFAIPREQLVRPGQRRSLARRALAGIVPDEILNRKRKASVGRAPVLAFSAERPRLLEISQNMISETLCIVNPKVFWETMRAAMDGQEVSTVRLLRTVGIELWLRNLSKHGVVVGTDRNTGTNPNCSVPTVFSAEKN